MSFVTNSEATEMDIEELHALVTMARLDLAAAQAVCEAQEFRASLTGAPGDYKEFVNLKRMVEMAESAHSAAVEEWMAAGGVR